MVMEIDTAQQAKMPIKPMNIKKPISVAMRRANKKATAVDSRVVKKYVVRFARDFSLKMVFSMMIFSLG